MQKQIKIFYVVLSILLSSAVFSGVALAATTGTVTATVTAQNVSVTVTDGTVSYGTLSTTGTQDTTTTGLNDSQTATNNGNVISDFDVLGQSSAAWTLGATQGSEQYFHKFCTADCDGSPTWTALTTSYQALAASVATSGTQIFDLQIGMPSSTATYTEQSVDITVQVSAS